MDEKTKSVSTTATRFHYDIYAYTVLLQTQTDEEGSQLTEGKEEKVRLTTASY